ncbi:LacI family transcriptional regulator [Paenibacillus selenitireducens]|uniref:LacI family transcriptional regulator n=1 Tax=Paenibacillus selenitireducens TaxID=1324314 RepID=A0A1T2XAU3_9BACL|nr:LacI family DNA-binding transcriptional regulator [Paenibacillus selenitireducens]OPA76968.1 LacI family transcriptional regulator [Paenibacillus selenitireducens]
MVSIYDIAKRAQCSTMTVSRVINNTGRISEKTRQRVKAIMAEMNYVPNQAARSLVLQQTKIISLLITDITNPFYTTLARGAEDAAKRLGYQVMFSNSDENLDKEKEYIDTVLSMRVDGVLIAPAGDHSVEHLEKLRQYNIPFVLVDREVPGVESDRVLGDSKEGSKALVEHLIALGHRRIAFINGSLDISTARMRRAGYLETLKLNDIEVQPDYMFDTTYSRFDADPIIEKMIAMPKSKRPTAIFAANNFITLAAIRSLRAKGLRVPEDFSIVCFDDLDPDYIVDPFLTIAAQPAYDFGRIGMQMLIDRIHGPIDEYRSVILPSKLLVRQSSTPLT